MANAKINKNLYNKSWGECGGKGSPCSLLVGLQAGSHADQAGRVIKRLRMSLLHYPATALLTEAQRNGALIPQIVLSHVHCCYTDTAREGTTWYTYSIGYSSAIEENVNINSQINGQN